jgi:hypothetical protein
MELQLDLFGLTPSSSSPLSGQHVPARPPGGFQYLYDGRQLLAVIERRRDGWHVFAHGRNDIGTCADRAGALRFANTHITAFSS